ncbi:hypothetical protein [Kribbella sp. CA-293567]|uniref:hypothetical protein n=1 Tax=Kribbella sp. CA-293567 TaxID=3002436 RepID=UPI0022DD2E84|nr:hypothetical protein [Kribbella sp. CA-293567]WBQ04894.1 hypothetical protein OX958_33695 [Kribbella sp. CA-293567]
MKTRVGCTLAAGLLAVSGCGASGLQTGAGTVEKKTASAFLTTAESDWHRQVDTEPNQNLSPQARCYFVTGADGKQSLGTMACGPLRRLGTAERQVWDIARIEPTGGDKPGLELADDEQWKRSQLRPDSSAFWRPDDKPADGNADALAAPPAPAAKTGLTSVSGKREVLDLKPATDKLVVPDGTLTLKGVATPEIFGSGTEVLAPASGEKFVAAVFGTSPTLDPLTNGPAYVPGKTKGTPVTKWTVDVGGEQRPVTVFSEDSSAATVEQTLLVSVPKDSAEILLTATSGSVVQSLSLTTGKRTTPEVAAAYYRAGTSTELNKALPTTARNQGQYFKSSFSLSLKKAVLTPWDPARGWAPQGKAWVRVEIGSRLDYTYVIYSSTWVSPFLTVTADGAPIPATQGNPDADVITFAVPATTKTVQLTTNSTLKFTSNTSGADPMAGAVTFPPLTATATFR